MLSVAVNQRSWTEGCFRMQVKTDFQVLSSRPRMRTPPPPDLHPAPPFNEASSPPDELQSEGTPSMDQLHRGLSRSPL